MYVIVLDYLVALERINAALDVHREWLEEHYAAGCFYASGPREPRVGGVILAAGPRQEIERAVANDPFAVQGLANHTIIEFHPSRSVTDPSSLSRLLAEE